MRHRGVLAAAVVVLGSACRSAPCHVPYMDISHVRYAREIAAVTPELPDFDVKVLGAHDGRGPNSGALGYYHDVNCESPPRVWKAQEYYLKLLLVSVGAWSELRETDARTLAESFVSGEHLPYVFPGTQWDTAVLATVQQMRRSDRKEFRELVLADSRSREGKAVASGSEGVLTFAFVAATSPGDLVLDVPESVVISNGEETRITLTTRNVGESSVEIEVPGDPETVREAAVWLELRDTHGALLPRQLYVPDPDREGEMWGIERVEVPPGGVYQLDIAVQHYTSTLEPGEYTVRWCFSGAGCSIDFPTGPLRCPVIWCAPMRLTVADGSRQATDVP